jgi:hypothetical protein
VYQSFPVPLLLEMFRAILTGIWVALFFTLESNPNGLDCHRKYCNNLATFINTLSSISAQHEVTL